jgi:transposase-like protein
VEELLAERGIAVDHLTVYRWVQTFTSEFIDAARPARHACGDRWFVDETSPPLEQQRLTAHKASTQCVRDHLRRPIPGRRNLLMETAGNTVSEIDRPVDPAARLMTGCAGLSE